MIGTAIMDGSTTQTIGGDRKAFEPLANELARQQQFAEAILAGEPLFNRRETDVSALDWAAYVMEERTDDSRTAKSAAL